jgi:hypothetical protein
MNKLHDFYCGIKFFLMKITKIEIRNMCDLIDIYIYIYVYIYTNICIYVYIHVYIYIFVHMLYIYGNAYVYICVYIGMISNWPATEKWTKFNFTLFYGNKSIESGSQSSLAYKYLIICVYEYIYTCCDPIYTYIYTYIHMYILI